MKPAQSLLSSSPMVMIVVTLFVFLISAQTPVATKETPATPLWRGKVLSERINGTSADQVWSLFEDFCNIYKFFPIDISFCNKGVPNRPGLSRYLATKIPSPAGDNTTVVQWERHELLVINPKKRYLTYRMRENNQGIRNYVPTLKVLKKDYGSQIQWSYVADPVEGVTLDIFRAALQSILASVVGNIQRIF